MLTPTTPQNPSAKPVISRAIAIWTPSPRITAQVGPTAELSPWPASIGAEQWVPSDTVML